MTRNSIANFICNKLNKPELLDVAVEFVKREYIMICNSYNWRDMEVRYDDNIPATVNSIALNEAVQRVAAVRINGNQVLDPVNAVLASQVDPRIFESTGTPTMYEEYYDVPSATRYIRVYPVPTVSTPITVVGIRAVDELTSADQEPSIRGIDNALIAFAEADLLERILQYGLAQTKRQEAQQKLQDAIAADQASRSNIPRGIKPMSVTGDTMAELTDAVSARTGRWAPEDRVLIREFLRRNWITAYNARLWRESQILIAIGSTEGNEVVLPNTIGEVLGIKQDTAGVARLPTTDTSLAFELDPDIFHQTGSIVAYSLMTPVGVPQQPVGSERLKIASTDASDKGNVFIRALDGNCNEWSVSLGLTGTTPVTTALSASDILTFSKQATNGTITMTGNSTNTIYSQMGPDETSRKYMRVRLLPVFSSTFVSGTQPVPPPQGETTTLLVLGKRTIKPFERDEDTPILRGFGNCLINGACADMFRKNGDSENANVFSQRAAADLAALKQLETDQAEDNNIIVPYTEPDPRFFRGAARRF